MEVLVVNLKPTHKHKKHTQSWIVWIDMINVKQKQQSDTGTVVGGEHVCLAVSPAALGGMGLS